MRFATIAATLVIAVGLTKGVLAQSEETVNTSIDSVLGDHAQFRDAFTALKKGVAAHDAAAVAKLVSYPIVVRIGGKETTIGTMKDFIGKYDAIFVPEIVKAVAEQNYADLFVNYQGVMFGNGEVWINGICKDKACKSRVVRIITIQSTAG